MALSVLQLPTLESLYQSLRAVATEDKRRILRVTEVSEFLDTMTAEDLDALAVPAEIRADLVDFRTVLSEKIALFNGNAVTPTINHRDVIDKIREMKVV